MTANSSDSPPPADDPAVPLRSSRSPRRRPVAKLGPEPPSYGTVHMLLWIACTGVYLAANRDLYSGDLPPLAALLMLCQALPRGAALAGLAIFIRRRWQRAPWPIEPGEWLVAIAGMWLATEVVLIRWSPSDRFHNPAAVHAALACMMLVLPTLAQGLSVDWKCFFSFLVVVFAWPLLVALLDAGRLSDSQWLALGGTGFVRPVLFGGGRAGGGCLARSRTRRAARLAALGRPGRRGVDCRVGPDAIACRMTGGSGPPASPIARFFRPDPRCKASRPQD